MISFSWFIKILRKCQNYDLRLYHYEIFKCVYIELQTHNQACKEDGTILVQLISLVYIVFYGV